MVSAELIEKKILNIRGHKVIAAEHLAGLYGVTTKYLNQQVRRNIDRFPPDFLFQLTKIESNSLRLQFATSKKGRGGRRYPPLVFTEQGVAMLSSVLRSPRAIQVNIQIVPTIYKALNEVGIALMSLFDVFGNQGMRAFVKLRQLMSSHADLARKIGELESKYDGQFHVVFEAIRRLLTPPPPKKRRIGFITQNIRNEVSHASR